MNINGVLYVFRVWILFIIIRFIKLFLNISSGLGDDW